MNRILIMCVLALAGIAFACSAAFAETSPRDKVVELLESIESGDPAPIAFINPDKYIQHNLDVGDGLAGFGEIMQQLPEGSGRAEVVRAFEDGDYVFSHTVYDFFGPRIGFDIFRFEDGLIVEHWDNLQPIADGPNESGRTQTDGATELADLDRTEENKALVEGFVRDVLMGAHPETITDYITPDSYIQHNPGVGDGLDGLGAALAAMAEAGTPMVYDANHMILGQGNFVLAVSEGQFLGDHAAFYDLFRVEDGRLVEHWDTIQPIPAREDWKNDNGKF